MEFRKSTFSFKRKKKSNSTKSNIYERIKTIRKNNGKINLPLSNFHNQPIISFSTMECKCGEAAKLMTTKQGNFNFSKQTRSKYWKTILHLCIKHL
jgi:hypothetical protein